jgi:hypothetical protein
MNDNAREYLRNGQNLTGHLQRRMMGRKQEGDEWVGDSILNTRIDNLACELARRKTASGKKVIRDAAYALIRKEIRKESERRKYRKRFNESVAAFSRPIDQRCLGQGQDPYGTVPVWMNDRYGPSKTLTELRDELRKIEDDVNIF